MGVSTEPNGTAPDMVMKSDGLLPGTTFPANGTAIQTSDKKSTQHDPPACFDGPVIHGKSTTVTLYEPAQLAKSPAIPALYHVINRAFSESHAGTGVLPASIDRLDSPEQFLQQVGNDPGTFVYIITWTGTDEPIATVGAHRYVTPVVISDVGSGKQGSTFKRVHLPKAPRREIEGREAWHQRVQSPTTSPADAGMETWELKTMAVDTKLQGQGLASYLMKLVDEEVKRRFRATLLAESTDEQMYAARRQFHMVLTTLKECNETFYARRGYMHDYETAHEPGFLGSPTGFHVLHMSKILEV
ncbi:hypothetical protein LTR85_003567 [Meristemomyces frigidus]|nr:hypothetical protein LTR85_003567 [Meristemomyces frigidus]